MSEYVKICPICNKEINNTENIVNCPDCGVPYHADCYNNSGCVLCSNKKNSSEEKTENVAESGSENTSDKIGKKTGKKKIIIPIVSVLAVAVIALGAVFGMKVYKEKKIEYYLSAVDSAYSEFDFDKVGECYDSLEKLGYNVTTEQREVLQYDREAYPVANKYYTTLTDVYDKLENNNFTTVRELLNALAAATDALVETEINTDSKIGTYIQNVQKNPMFTALKTAYLDNNDIDVDNGLVSSGHRMLLKIDIEFILKTEFPYSQSADGSEIEQATDNEDNSVASGDELSSADSDDYKEAKKEQQKTAFSMLTQYLNSKGMSDNDVYWICNSDNRDDKFSCFVLSGEYKEDDIVEDLLAFQGAMTANFDYVVPLSTILMYSNLICIYSGGDSVHVEFEYYKRDRNGNMIVNDSTIPGTDQEGLYSIGADIDISSYIKSSYLDLEFNPTYGISQSDKNTMCQYAAAMFNKWLDCTDDLLNEIGLSLKDLGFESYVS